MIYIYNCYGGTHSSVIAAQYHLGNLDPNRIPSKEEILSLKNFNKLTKKDFGKLFLHGTDQNGDKVYTIGRARSKVLIPGMSDLTSVFQQESELAEKVIFSNTSPTVPIAMTFGGLFSRWLKIDFIGVPLLVAGVKQSFKDVVKLVNRTKEVSYNDEFKIKIIENKDIKN